MYLNLQTFWPSPPTNITYESVINTPISKWEGEKSASSYKSVFSTQLQQWSLHGFSTSSFCKYTQALGYSKTLMDHVMDHIRLKTAAICLMVNTCFLFWKMSFIFCYWFKFIFTNSDVLLCSKGCVSFFGIIIIMQLADYCESIWLSRLNFTLSLFSFLWQRFLLKQV